MNCNHCNKDFEPAFYNSKYCSKECYGTAKSRRHWDKIKHSVTNICQHCNKEFNSDKITTYCSRACISKATAPARKKFLNIPDCIGDASRKLDKTLGYVRLYVPMHPEANTWGYVYEHRIIAEQFIVMRRLLPNEVVHHKNGLRWDNSLSNLEVMDKNDHAKLHGQRPEDLI